MSPLYGEDDILDIPPEPSSSNTSSLVSAEVPQAPIISVTPEVLRQAEAKAGEIVRLSQDVEIMATTRAKLEAALGRSEIMADVLEGKALKHIPIIKHIPLLNRIKIPIEGIIGLIPVVGDAVAASAALYIVTEAHLAGVPRSEIKKMLTKIAVDSSLGSIPLVGDIFDFFYKSNSYNIEIFRKYVQEYIAKHEALKDTVLGAELEKRAEERVRHDDILDVK